MSYLLIYELYDCSLCIRHFLRVMSRNIVINHLRKRYSKLHCKLLRLGYIKQTLKLQV